MKRFAIGLAVGVLALFAAAPAQAFLSVSADVPMQYTFSEPGATVDSVSGLKVTLDLPIFLGIGYENYTVVGGTDETNFQMLDLSMSLPLPFLNIGAGVGFGAVKLDDTTNTTLYTPGVASQYFITAGYAFLPLIDIHLGYHVVNGKVEETLTKVKSQMGGTMISLGVRVGF